MEGNITEIDETAFTDWEKRNHSERKLKVVATNLGPLAKGDNGGEKMVYRWKPGEHATFYEEELLKINE